jgi:hypothetical protein
MSRRDLDPEDRDKASLVLSQLHDCVCGETFEVDFTAPDGVFEAEDMLEPPITSVVCPACGRAQAVSYSGWSVNDES